MSLADISRRYLSGRISWEEYRALEDQTTQSPPTPPQRAGVTMLFSSSIGPASIEVIERLWATGGSPAIEPYIPALLAALIAGPGQRADAAVTAADRDWLYDILTQITPGEWTWTDCLEPEHEGEDQDCGNLYVAIPMPTETDWRTRTVRHLWFGDMENNTGEDYANARFVAAMPTMMPRLLAALDAAEQERDAALARVAEAQRLAVDYHNAMLAYDEERSAKTFRRLDVTRSLLLGYLLAEESTP